MRILSLLFIFSFLVHPSIFAQASEEEAVQKTIEAFFEAFHQQDSILIKQTVSEDIILQTIGKNREGETRMRTDEFSDLIKSIVSIPDTTDFQEKILSFNIQVDGAMANAWTPYEFWINGNFSHCGVNSFQLFKDGDAWKIIYLVDTRRREGCHK
ncbi:MAG: nuclear transport factor 2 family protein [Bacteroidota bacterium]